MNGIMKKVCVGVFFCAIMPFLLSLQAFAHQEASEHNKELEKVLLGDGYPKRVSVQVSNSITALEEASRLTIDQFGGNLQGSLDKLNAMTEPSISGIPKSISDIDYSEQLDVDNKLVTAKTHRKYTHQGWGQVYPLKRCENFWNTRRKLLLNTVNSVFDFGFGSSITLFGYSDKCDSLCTIIYYVHILGDYDEADNYKKIILLAPIAGLKEEDKQTKNDPLGMIPELENAIEILFEDQDYDKLIREMEKIYKKARKLEKKEIDSDEKFLQYKECSDELMKVLQKYIPDLLKTQEFFTDVFPQA